MTESADNVQADGPALAATLPGVHESDSSDWDFEQVVDRYEGPLLRYVGKLIGRGFDEAQDVVQETFMRLHRHVSENGPDSIENLSSWLFRVAHNLTMDLGRKRQRQSRLKLAVEEQVQADPPEQRSQPPVALDGLIQDEQTQRAMDELGQLPDHLREVVILKILQDMTLRQIAEVLDLTVGNAGYRLNQGLKQLAERLKTAQVI